MKQIAITDRTAAGIARAIETAILAGRFDAGAALPTVRELAASLKVSAATASAAYRLLQARGLTVGDRRRGTRVRVPGFAPPPLRQTRGASAHALVDLASGNPDPGLLPSLTTACRALPDARVLYGHPSENRALVAFATSELAADGLDVTGIAITSGALDAIDRVLRVHLRAGDRVAVEDPGYPGLSELIIGSGYAIEPIGIDAQGLLPDALERALTRRPVALVLTPRAQNPTGAALTQERADGLRAVLKRHRDLLVIENDPFGPVAGAPAYTLTTGRVHWAIVRSTSKYLGPDLRVAITAADPLTLSRLRNQQALGVRWVSHLLQTLVLALWSDPSGGRLLARAGETYAHRRGALLKALAAHGVHVTAASGFNVWIPVRHEAAAVQQLAEMGWAVAAGERFRIRSGPGIRISTSTLEPDAASRLAHDLATVIQSEPASLA